MPRGRTSIRQIRDELRYYHREGCNESLIAHFCSCSASRCVATSFMRRRWASVGGCRTSPQLCRPTNPACYSSRVVPRSDCVLRYALLHHGIVDGHPVRQITLLGKGNKTRTIRLSPDTWAALMQLKEKVQEKGFALRQHPVFRSRKGGPLSRQQIWRIVRNAARAAGLRQNVSPHWLRHAHASHALDNGAPTHLVKDSLGHKSLTTTSKYAHARPDDSSSLYVKA